MTTRFGVLMVFGSIFFSGIARPGLSAEPQKPASSQRLSAQASVEIEGFVQGLSAPTTDERVAAAKKLGDMGERAAPAISALIELLDDHGLETVKEDGRMFMTFGVTAGAAANALASIGKPAIQPLRVALKEPGAAKERVYWRAKALARMNQPAATETLLATLKQPTFPYRDQVAWALGDCTDARALPALLLLAKDEDPKMRRGAVKGLDGNKDPKAVDALVEALADTDKEVRGSAATGLYSAADPRTFDVLVSALKDPDDFVRNLSAQALGAIGDRRAIGPLVVLVANDPENLVRFQAGRALEAITGEHFGENGAQWQAWWEKRKPQN